MARRAPRRSTLALVLGAAALALAASGLVLPLLRPRSAGAAPPAGLPPGEAAALRDLREIADAQLAVRNTDAIDTDADGRGEYGFLAELAGAVPVRIYDPATDGPLLGVDPYDILHPAFLPPRFGAVAPSAKQEGVVRLGAYVFQVFLPDVMAAHKTAAVFEDPAGGTGAFPDSENAQRLWCAYAWPMVLGPDSRRTFFVNQAGILLATNNLDGAYEGLALTPDFDAAYSDATGGHDMGARPGITALIRPFGHAANDGHVWVVAP